MKVAHQKEKIVPVAACGDICPVKKTAEIIEGKWTSLIIRELLVGKKRYFELQKALVDISPKVLSTRLRMLEREQIIYRHVIATVPPSTEYELTAMGKNLEQVLMAMADFGRLMLEQDSNS
jgi:DNA-binding HxlR family transcriptional regulator